MLCLANVAEAAAAEYGSVKLEEFEQSKFIGEEMVHLELQYCIDKVYTM